MKFGIRKIIIKARTRSQVFFHNPGMLTTDRQRNMIDLYLGRHWYIDMEYEVFHMLDFGGGPCINSKQNPNYQKDICAHEKLLKVRYLYFLQATLQILLLQYS